MTMSAYPFTMGDLVSSLDGYGERSLGLVLDCRVIPNAYKDTSCTVPAYEVDVMFGHLNTFLKVVRSAKGGAVGANIITVSDTVVRHTHSP